MTTTPGTPLSAKPISTRWLWAVRVAVVLCALIPFLILCREAPVGLVFLAPLYPGILVGLRKKTRKSGLAWAVGMGLVGLAFPGLLGWGAGPREIRAWVGILVFVLMHMALLATAIKAYYSLGREAGDWKKLAWGVLGPAFFAMFVATSPAMVDPLVGPMRGWTAANQASAVGSLRTINTSEVTYASTYDRGFSPSLAALAPAPAGAEPSALAAGLIDDLLAGGRKSGYTFTYSPGAKDSTGHIKSYMVVARPLEYGKTATNNYFTDETGVIRHTEEDRPAIAKDPAISG